MSQLGMSNDIAARFPFGMFEPEETIIGEAGFECFFGTESGYRRDPFTIFSPEITFRQGAGGVEIPTFGLKDIVGYEALIPNEVYNYDNGIKTVFDAMVVDLVIDNSWVRRLRQYVYGFYSRNSDHTEFFGGPYLGTHRIVYKTADRKDWFSDIIDVDEVVLRDELIKCKYVNKDFKVSSDAFNLSIPYLMHCVQKSKLSDGQKHEALINLVIMFHYRIMTSIMNHYFGYLANRKVAEAAYNALTLKFDIKRYGSWNALFKARAENVIDSKRGIHYKTFTTMANDKDVVYMVNDMESRLKSVINDYSRVFYKVRENEQLIETDDGFVLLDGKLVVKDIQKNINQRRTYIETILNSGDTFYKEELVDYAIKGMDRTPPDKFKQVVRDFPYQYVHPKGDKYRVFVEDTVTHLFEYLAANNIKQSNVRQVVLRMRGAYTSNKSTNPLLFKLRDEGDDIIAGMTGIRTRSTVTAMRTSLMLYIVLRTITMDAFR